jgi:hypothetical protein
VLVYSIFPKTESTLFSSRNNGLWRSKSIPRARLRAGKVFIKQSYCRLLVVQNMRFCSTTCRNLGENLLSKQNLNRVQSRFLPVSTLLLNAGTRDPFPTRAREDSFTVVFNASKIFGRKTAQLSETLRESVYSGSASENRLHNTAG